MLKAAGQQRAVRGLVNAGQADVIAMLYHDNQRETLLCRWPADAGFPMLDNRDAGNPGKGERIATWRITLPESLTLGNVVTRVQVLSAEGGVIVQEDFPVPVAKEVGKVLLVYVNQYVR